MHYFSLQCELDNQRDNSLEGLCGALHQEVEEQKRQLWQQEMQQRDEQQVRHRALAAQEMAPKVAKTCSRLSVRNHPTHNNQMNYYIVRSYRDVIVITKFAITKYAIRRASKAQSIVMY